jgi:hypothetical protein
MKPIIEKIINEYRDERQNGEGKTPVASRPHQALPDMKRREFIA